MAFAQTNSIVFGSGFLSPEEKLLFKPLHISGVRGKLSEAIISNQLGVKPDVISDPGLLISQILPSKKHESEIKSCYIPHYTDSAENYKHIAQVLNSHVLLPTLPIEHFMKQFTQFNKVFSRSLHGLIFADAMRLPRVWVEPSQKMRGNDFKFLDYFSSINCEIPFLPITNIDSRSSISKSEFVIDSTVLDDIVNTQDIKLRSILKFFNLFKVKSFFNSTKIKTISDYYHPGWEGAMDFYK